MSDDSDIAFSDDDFDDVKHSKIVEGVLNLNKSQHLKKPSRTEPTPQISEFNLVKSITGKNGSVQIDKLAKVLKSRKKHVDIGSKLESTKKKSRTLPKPLEQPQAKRIRRSVGYEKNRFLFDRWEAFVTSNRAQPHQVFPLGAKESLKKERREAQNFTSTLTYKSSLQKEIEEIQSSTKEYHIEAPQNDPDEFQLTLKELKEKRKESAKLRAHESFKAAKARKQKKIKSKKYHRILRKEKIKEKLKQFEELQKTNPEEALKKLDEIEKARALERFSLRHKGTGQWAKSKQVRAKYDKESRQILAQQLQISRDLTQKQKALNSDSEDEGFVTEDNIVDNQGANNPWVNGPQPEKEVTEFFSGYKKYWTEQNKKVNKDQSESDNEVDLSENNDSKEVDDEAPCAPANKKVKKKKSENKKVEKGPPEKRASLDNASGNWDIEDIFENAEKKVAKKLNKKMLQVEKAKKRPKDTKNPKAKKTKENKKKNKKVSLEMPTKARKPVIDEELTEESQKENQASQNDENISALKNILQDSRSKQPKSDNIDPEKFMNPSVTNLDSSMPDLILEDENTEKTTQKNIIIEAFEDVDIADDFTKEKKEEIEKDAPKDIDLNLPGWGSWAGTGINSKNQRKRRRFIVKMPEAMPRRDDNKGALIINEKAATKVRPHLVSEVPFPFKSVKDYEASIRAPIGNTFVPELAYRRFIKPAVQTKMGAVIEPATTSVLMGIPNK